MLTRRDNAMIVLDAHRAERPFRGRLTAARRRLVPAAAWSVLAVACYLLGEYGEKARVPAPQLVLSLLVGVVLALTGVAAGNLPRAAVSGSHATIGVLMGSYLGPSVVRALAGTVLPLTGATVVTIALSVGTAVLLARVSRISLADALMALIPGGSAAIVASAEAIGADSRVVAFAQYLRVGLVALSAPVIVALAGGTAAAPPSPGAFPALARLVTNPHQAVGLLQLIVICVAGVRAGARLSLPAPSVLGPMALTALLLMAGTSHTFTPAGPLRDLAFVLVGLEVGLRFNRTSVRRVRRLAPYLIGATGLMCLACAALAWCLAVVTGMPFLDAYLATTPGGINAVVATAASAGRDVAVISAVQSIRLFTVVLLTPSLIRWMVRRRDAAIRTCRAV
ncbi:AbrB family transcriptional regulator [Actinoplanes siamensis]|uniref:Membrane protein n=1 Tax=Actinoplanes siamensis TaxID=1223317 RepID=A0A919N4G5_9ACTN|nr:AbrB family transcriptional regulator [Actinoplanes siamensis]GIF04186.1 membrane protein [Actinoplanes siamensis]